jgi:biopolymer transport protein ExbD
MRRFTALIRDERRGQGAIDLTPMLDVVFIMLIFFIVTASFVKQAGLEVDRPEAVTAEDKRNARILVAVSASNQVWIDHKAIDPRGVKLAIERMHAENPRGGLVVQADMKSSTRTVASVLDAARDAGIEDLAVATVKKK